MDKKQLFKVFSIILFIGFIMNAAYVLTINDKVKLVEDGVEQVIAEGLMTDELQLQVDTALENLKKTRMITIATTLLLGLAAFFTWRNSQR